MAVKKKKKRTSKKKKRLSVPIIPILRILAVLAVVALILFGVSKLKSFLSATAVKGTARESRLGSYYTGTLVVARDETLYQADGKSTINFIAAEGAHVNRGTTICSVYASGYNASEMTKLENYREDIRTFHTTQVFGNYVDAALESENSIISNYAIQVRSLVRGRGTGSLSSLEKLLSSELTVRQDYLKQKYPDDQALTQLYKEESDQEKKIESWTTTYNATEDCLVSFYTDGYENVVNAQTYTNLTPSDVKTVARGGTISGMENDAGKQSIFRAVSEDVWYGLFLCQDKDFNPTIGFSYAMHLEGFDDLEIEGIVQSFTRIGSDLLLRLRINGDVTPVLNIRSCEASVGSYIEGFYVPMRAIYNYGDALGVVVTDGGGKVFVEVTVISYPDQDTAFVKPVLSGSPLVDGASLQLF